MPINKKQIEQQAKQILNKFADALKKIKEFEGEIFVDREKFERNEKRADLDFKNLKKPKKDFKERMLKNAPKHDLNFIIAEAKNWK